MRERERQRENREGDREKDSLIVFHCGRQCERAEWQISELTNYNCTVERALLSYWKRGAISLQKRYDFPTTDEIRFPYRKGKISLQQMRYGFHTNLKRYDFPTKDEIRFLYRRNTISLRQMRYRFHYRRGTISLRQMRDGFHTEGVRFPYDNVIRFPYKRVTIFLRKIRYGFHTEGVRFPYDRWDTVSIQKGYDFPEEEGVQLPYRTKGKIPQKKIQQKKRINAEENSYSVDKEWWKEGSGLVCFRVSTLTKTTCSSWSGSYMQKQCS